MNEVLELASALVARPSVTPVDAGCQELVAQRLAAAGCTIEHLPFGEVRNLWAWHGDEHGPTLILLGHTDVVPPGPEAEWTSPPFVPEVRAGMLYGRGAADMKGSVAAMVLALERFVAAQPGHRGRVAILLTSDEEGRALDGVRRVAELFRDRGERLDWCLVGEPSAREHLGDTVRVGRRGSLSGRLRVRGVQGHVAYPERALNPIHALAPALAELVATRWDEGNTEFPPTSLQFSSIRAGTGADNVIPGHLEAEFNFRYAATPMAELQRRTEAVLARHALDARIAWHDSGQPFLAPPDGALRGAVRAAGQALLGQSPEESTGGGTSDGRFLAPLGVEVVEVGPVNASIHKIDECVRVADLERLAQLYAGICARLLV